MLRVHSDHDHRLSFVESRQQYAFLLLIYAYLFVAQLYYSQFAFKQERNYLFTIFRL